MNMSISYNLINAIEEHLWSLKSDIQTEIDGLTEFCRCNSCRKLPLSFEEKERKVLLESELLSIEVRYASIKALSNFSDVLESFDFDTFTDILSELEPPLQTMVWQMIKFQNDVMTLETSFPDCPNRGEIIYFLTELKNGLAHKEY